MDVERLLERVLLDPELLGAGAKRRESDLHRLLHHVAELAGEDELVALRGGRLDEEDVAARAGDGEPGRDAGDRGAVGRLAVELLPSERVADLFEAELDGRLDLAGAIRVAVFRSSLPSSRSSCRTPASRV